MTERTWKIRDWDAQGRIGPEREVTLAQYRAELEAAKAKALAAFNSDRKSI